MDGMSTAEYLKQRADKAQADLKQMLAKSTEAPRDLFVRYNGRVYKVKALAVVDGKSMVTIRPTDAELRKKGPLASLHCKINTLTVPGSKTVWLGNPPPSKNWK